MDRRWAILLWLGLGGCVGPEETRFLTCFQRPASVEARSYDAHDPFADESAGPDTYTRPRAFVDPRTDTRKNQDFRFLQAMHPAAGNPQYAGGPVPAGPAVPGRGGRPIPTTTPVVQVPYQIQPTATATMPATPWAAAPVVPAY